MKLVIVLLIFSIFQKPASAEDDNLGTLVLQVLDKGVLRKLYPTNMNQEVTLYITKYKQLIAQLLTLIKKIDFHTFKKIKVYLKKEHLLNLISKYDLELSNSKDKLGFNFNKIKLNRLQKYLSESMYIWSKLYTVYIYSKMILNKIKSQSTT